jgi:hypothetical protein
MSSYTKKTQPQKTKCSLRSTAAAATTTTTTIISTISETSASAVPDVITSHSPLPLTFPPCGSLHVQASSPRLTTGVVVMSDLLHVLRKILVPNAEVVADKMLANPDMTVLWDDIMSLSTTELVDSFGIPLIKVGSLKKVIRTEFQQHQSFTDMTGDTSEGSAEEERLAKRAKTDSTSSTSTTTAGAFPTRLTADNLDQVFATFRQKVNLSYQRLCTNLGQSPKIADVSSSDSKEEVDYNVGNIYDREDSKKSVMEYVSDLVKQFLMKEQNSVDKKDYPLLLLGGGSGMGKSFLLDVIGLKWAKECLVNCEVNVENNYIAIPITFNTTTSLLAKELKLDAESKLCLRALYFLFGATMGFADFFALILERFDFSLTLDVIIKYCHKLHGKKVVVFLVDELLKITKGKDPDDPIDEALTALGRVSQGYTSSTDCLVMGIASSLAFGPMLEWKTKSHRRIIWCRLPFFSTITLLKIFENHPLSGNSKFQRLASYCNRLPKVIGQLLLKAKDKSDAEFEMQYGNIVHDLTSLNSSNVSPQYFEELLLFLINKRDIGVLESENIPNTNWSVADAVLHGCVCLEEEKGQGKLNLLQARNFAFPVVTGSHVSASSNTVGSLPHRSLREV